MSLNTEIGGATANSYVSKASADEYLEARENADGWVNVSSNATTPTDGTTAKENLLKQATREIDRTFRFHGSKFNQGIKGQDTYQFLEFPREENIDADSNEFIPDEVKFATYEQALWIKERQGLKTAPEGTPITRRIIGQDAFNFLKPWVNRQVQKVNAYGWM
jgi:hypothetical protein